MAPNPTETVDQQPAGTAPVFSDLVKEHWEAVYRLLHSLTGDVHESEDLTQETFLRALSRLESFQAGTSLRSWLLRIGTNAFFDERRKRQRQRTGSLDHDPPCLVPAPGQALETAERGERVRSALLKLSEQTRLVFHLRVEEDLAFRDIAELAGTTEQAARWHMHHARQRLLEFLGDDF